MGKLRKGWQDAKGDAQLVFKNHTGRDQLHALVRNEVPPPWPFKFEESLGPALDKWESAKKLEDKAKHARTARSAIQTYRGDIGNKKTALDKLDLRICKLMLDELTKIETALG